MNNEIKNNGLDSRINNMLVEIKNMSEEITSVLSEDRMLSVMLPTYAAEARAKAKSIHDKILSVIELHIVKIVHEQKKDTDNLSDILKNGIPEMTGNNNSTIPQGMKPFKLERALAGDPVVMRNGEKIIAIYHIKESNSKLNILAVRDDGEEYWSDINGREDSKIISEYDLFMAAKEVTIWKNVYKESNDKYFIGNVDYNTQEEAENHNLPHLKRVKTIPVTFTAL